MSNPQAKGKATNDVFEASSFLQGPNAAYIESLYDQYVADPQSVDESWREFFQGLAERRNRAGQPSWARTDWPELTDETGRQLAPAKPAKPSREAPRGSSLKPSGGLRLLPALEQPRTERAAYSRAQTGTWVVASIVG